MPGAQAPELPVAELPETITPEWVEANHGSLLARAGAGGLRLDCSRLRRADSLCLAFLSGLRDRLAASGKRLVLAKVPEGLRGELARGAAAPPPAGRPPPEPWLIRLGGATLSVYREARTLLLLLSECLYWSTFGFPRRKTVYRGDTVNQMIRLGSSSLPIVAMLSFLIGFTLAMQSAQQLQKFGATIFLASGIGLGMVTEIGPMLTAIIVAGRSGSAITAEIATMVVQEEVGALHAMAINPIHFLVLPRFWALSATLPLLTICSAVSGIAAGLAVGVFFFQLSMTGFLTQLRDVLAVKFVFQCLVKALTFAWIITLVAVAKGISVRGGADAVGKATTSCVVTCIFCVILADALFSFIFY